MLSAFWLTLDLLLVAVTVWVAWRLLFSNDLVTATVLFICFGLLLALGWVRLEAPDVALAEVVIGAGVTGTLVLLTVRRLARRDGSNSLDREPR